MREKIFPLDKDGPFLDLSSYNALYMFFPSFFTGVPLLCTAIVSRVLLEYLPFFF